MSTPNLAIKNITPVILIISIIVSLGLGWFLGANLGFNSPSWGKEVRGGGYTYINPLLECDLSQDYQPKNIQVSSEEIKDYVNSQINAGNAREISVYFRDLNNGPWFGVNEKLEFMPASLYKVPFLVSFLKLSESQPNILMQKALFNVDPDDSEQNVKPERRLIKGQYYTYEELLEQLVVYSDNDVLAILDSVLEDSFQDEVERNLGVLVRVNSEGFGVINVRSYASVFRILYNASFLSREMSEKALEILSRTGFSNGLKAGIPSGITLSHKFGEKVLRDIDTGEFLETQLHDCGIVYYPGNPYLLCVMTRGDNFDRLSQTIKSISAMVFSNVDAEFSR